MTASLLERRLPLFPISAQVTGSSGISRLAIAGCDLQELARRFGTPLYLFDRASLDEAVDTYRRSLARHHPGNSALTYAGKAYLCTAIAQWAARQGLWVDCTGQSEMTVAKAAEVSREKLLVHGVNKSDADLEMALQAAGTLVIDNLDELHRVAQRAASRSAELPNLWLRLRPGLPVDTHVYTQTGQSESKFGMDFAEAAHAVRLCRQVGMPLTGLHFHQGSHFHEAAPVGAGLRLVLDFMTEMRADFGWMPQTVCPGGGWGVAYHEDDLPQPDIDAYIQHIAEALLTGCNQRELPIPTLHIEPGRSLVARAGVALYRVGTIKRTATRNWLLLDGGMADNPRPALYGARYSALPVDHPDRPPAGSFWLGGPYCESGDVMIENLLLPKIEIGEIIAVPVSGAYHLSMGSNYNGACRPAVIWLESGQAHLIQQRETIQDLLRRDCPLP